jgi:hypothetical protein
MTLLSYLLLNQANLFSVTDSLLFRCTIARMQEVESNAGAVTERAFTYRAKHLESSLT